MLIIRVPLYFRTHIGSYTRKCRFSVLRIVSKLATISRPSRHWQSTCYKKLWKTCRALALILARLRAQRSYGAAYYATLPPEQTVFRFGLLRGPLCNYMFVFFDDFCDINPLEQYKNTKKWHFYLRMSFFLCNFAAQNVTQVWPHRQLKSGEKYIDILKKAFIDEMKYEIVLYKPNEQF